MLRLLIPLLVPSLGVMISDLRAQLPDVELMGELPPVLGESSGVAVSRVNDGVLWTHNDSDNDAVLYAIDITGELLGTVALEVATVRDWEDVSLGPCVEDRSAHCLYVADTGDNMRQRSVYSIYIIVEPLVSSKIDVDSSTQASVQRVDFRYPDAPHDAEGLAVAPEGDIYIVTKGWDGTARLFVITREAVERAIQSSVTVTAAVEEDRSIETGGALPMLITGAAFSPSGKTMVARSYVGFYFFDRDDAGKLQPREQTCQLGYREPQGEGIDFLDEATLVLTSESLHGRPGTIHRVRCDM
ncbi:MAG: hypothetical protein JSW71_18675 [Gemmatimonadota bacterium]|nr:MAG: hypothetical protein JSW71_18675 [Gemmatimonadota bacterium]